LELYTRIQADPAQAPQLGESTRRALANEYQADLFLVAVPQAGRGAAVLLYGLHQGRPDRIEMRAAARDAGESLAQQLSTPVRLTAPWSGLLAVDTAEVSFPLVYALPAGVPPGTTVRPGDRIRSVAGRPVLSRRDLEAATGELRVGEKISVSVERAGAVRTAELVIAETPTIPVPGDPGLLTNKTLADLGSLRARTDDARLKSLAALVVGIAYLKAGEPDLALRRGFQEAMLPEGDGISTGTVAYLRGLALEASGKAAESGDAFSAAAGSPGATLWRDDGPLVAPLARARLTSSR
jgi:hypothetical protein